MPTYVSFDEHGILRDRDMTMEARIVELTQANQIHIDDVYEAIALLKDWLECAEAERGAMSAISKTRAFLTKMAGPRR